MRPERDAELENEVFENESFRGQDLSGLRTSGCTFRGCDFTLAQINGSEHAGSDFDNPREGLRIADGADTFWTVATIHSK